MIPPPRPLTAALNHLLRATPVAMERLKPHAGRTAAFHVGPVTVAFTVQTTGEVTSAVPDAARDVEVRLSPFLLPRLALREEAAFREVQVTGDEAFAGEVRYLARNLRWDMEEDLSKSVGDIAAHRIAGGARTTAHWAAEAAKRTAAGAAEYWTEEKPLIATRVKAEDFIAGAKAFEADVAALERRIGKLEKS